MSHSFSAAPKDPDAKLDYVMEWGNWLRDDETIASANVITDSPDIIVTNISILARSVRWRLAGGARGQNYLITIRIETTAGQVDNRTVRLRVQSR